MAARSSKSAAKAAAPVDLQEIEKSNRILKVLTRVAETLIAVRPVEEVLAQVVDIVFDHIPADRGFLMLPLALKRNHISAAHTEADIDRTLDAAREVLRSIRDDGLLS